MKNAKTSIICPKCKCGYLYWYRKWFFGAMRLRCEFRHACGNVADPVKLLDNALSNAHALERKLRTMTEPKASVHAPASVSKMVKEMIFKFHPDRVGATVNTTEVIKALNKLKDSL